ncbi:MAG: twitching motility protein PilT [Lachnospiraceae bacterium]
MVEIISGVKGKGKTKILIQKVNDDIKLTHGTIVYLDKNNKHMYELSNRIRLIVVPDYKILNSDMFLGFIAGIVSQDHDLDKIYLDSFLTIAKIEGNLEATIKRLQEISEEFHVDFVISASIDKEDLPENLQSLVSVSL